MPDFVEDEGLSAENGVPDFSSPEKKGTFSAAR